MRKVPFIVKQLENRNRYLRKIYHLHESFEYTLYEIFQVILYKHVEKSPFGPAVRWSFRRVREESKSFAFLYGKKSLQKKRIRALNVAISKSLLPATWLPA